MLHAEDIVQMAKDAARYRWLRDCAYPSRLEDLANSSLDWDWQIDAEIALRETEQE